MATSNGGRLPFAACRRATWSVPRMIDSVTEAPVALRKAGTRMLRWASFQVPGKVAATNVLPCAEPRAGTSEAAPSAAAPASKLLRSMIMTDSSVGDSLFGKHAASSRIGGDVDRLAGAAHRRRRLARFAHFERGGAGDLDVVDDVRPERHD